MIVISKAQARAMEKLMDWSSASPYQLRERVSTLEALCNMGFARCTAFSAAFPRFNSTYEMTEEGRAALAHLEYEVEP